MQKNWKQLTEDILQAIYALLAMLKSQSGKITGLNESLDALKVSFNAQSQDFAAFREKAAAEIARLNTTNAAILRELAVTDEEKARAEAAVLAAQEEFEKYKAEVAAQDQRQEEAIASFSAQATELGEKVQAFESENEDQIEALNRIAKALDVSTETEGEDDDRQVLR